MKHLTSLALVAAATVAYAAGYGPLFFGAPMLGALLLLGGVALEVSFCRRLLRVRASTR